VQHARPPNDAEWSPQLYELVLSIIHCITIGIALDVTQIANVANLAVGTAVIVVEGVVVLARGDAAIG